MELKCSKKDRGWLYSTFKEVIGASGSVRHLILKIEMEIANIDPSTDGEYVDEAVRGFFDHRSELKLKLSLSRNPSEVTERCPSAGDVSPEVTQGVPH